MGLRQVERNCVATLKLTLLISLFCVTKKKKKEKKPKQKTPEMLNWVCSNKYILENLPPNQTSAKTWYTGKGDLIISPCSKRLDISGEKDIRPQIHIFRREPFENQPFETANKLKTKMRFDRGDRAYSIRLALCLSQRGKDVAFSLTDSLVTFILPSQMRRRTVNAILHPGTVAWEACKQWFE